jgi:hypothetical protein
MTDRDKAASGVERVVEVVSVQDSLGDMPDVPPGKLPSEAVIDLGARGDDGACGQPKATTGDRRDPIRSDDERDFNALHVLAASATLFTCKGLTSFRTAACGE